MKILRGYAMSHLGLPYIWGGDDSVDGYDCSGFVIELMKSCGLAPGHDMTANSLMYYYKQIGRECSPQFGALAFYGKKDLSTHIAFCLDHTRIIEAGGGGSRTKTREDAAKHNAYIRIRPVEYRRDYLRCYLPPYHFNK